MAKTNDVLLRDFLRLVSCGSAFTIGTEDGTGWVYYHDIFEIINVPVILADRPVTRVYFRDAREEER